MGIRIRTNLAALQGQHNLQKSSRSLNQALTRLSTGLRINQAADDVVYNSKAVANESQIRGIRQARINITNANSALGVAEGSASQGTEILQRMRELAVQAADDTISSSGRSQITDSFNDLYSEYERIVGASEFDNNLLLNGSYTSKTFQVGANNGDSISISIDDARASAIGAIARVTSSALTAHGNSAQSFSDITTVTLGSGSFTAGTLTTDGVSNVESDESALAYVNAINTVSGTTGVTAKVNANVVTFTYSSGDDTISSGDTIQINGVALTISTDIDTSGDSGNQSLVDAINDVANQTGVRATIDTSNDTITLTASDGRNIDIDVNQGARSSVTLDFFGYDVVSTQSNSAYRGTFTLTSNDAFDVAGLANGSVADQSVAVDSTTSVSQISFATSTSAATAIDILDKALEQLQEIRGDIGSKSERLQIAGDELNVRLENISAAQSLILDADIAVETANLTSSQILQQAGVSVLGQANQLPSIALSLLG